MLSSVVAKPLFLSCFVLNYILVPLETQNMGAMPLNHLFFKGPILFVHPMSYFMFQPVPQYLNNK